MSELNTQTVDQELPGTIALDDATLETPNNLGVDSEPEGQALADLLVQTAPAPEPETEHDTRPPNKEPGWVKKRIDSALQKALPEMVAAESAKIRAEYEAQIKPLREAQLSRDADDLVKQGEFKSRDIALEYLRMKQGLPLPVVQAPKADAQQAEIVPNEVKARAAELMSQDKYAQKMDGISPLSIYRSDPQVAAMVNSGQWDFSDVVKAAKQGQAAPTPSPVYSSNAATPKKREIPDLSKEEWKRFNDNLKKGVKVDMRR